MAGREVDVVPTRLAVGLEKAVAFRMADDATFDQIHFLGYAIALAAVTDQFAIALHGLEPSRQRFDFLLVQAPFPTQGLFAEGHAALGQIIDDKFPAGNRVAVLGELSGVMWVLAAPVIVFRYCFGFC